MITNKTIYQHVLLRSLKKSGSGQTTGNAQGASKKDKVLSYLPLIYGRKELL